MIWMGNSGTTFSILPHLDTFCSIPPRCRRRHQPPRNSGRREHGCPLIPSYAAIATMTSVPQVPVAFASVLDHRCRCPVALRKSVTVTRHVAVRHRGVTVRTQHVAVRHRGVTRTRHVAAGHRGIMARTRHLAFRHRGVAARRTHVAVGKRGAVAVKSTAVVRPVRPWVSQPYYGAVFDGVTLGAVMAATAVPTSPSIDLCKTASPAACSGRPHIRPREAPG